MKTLLLAFAFSVFTCLGSLTAQEPAAPTEKPVELKGDLKAFEILRTACEKHLKAWSVGRGRFITLDLGKKYAIRAEWMNDQSRIEELTLAGVGAEEKIDWVAAPELIWLQSPRVQVRFDPLKRVDILLDCQDQLFGRQHLHVVPTRRFAHLTHGRPWSRLLDTMDPECAKDCIYSAIRTDELITVESTSTQLEGVRTTFSAKKTNDWLIGEVDFHGSRSRMRVTIDFARNKEGVVVPAKLLIEGAAGEKGDLKKESEIRVVELDFSFKPEASRLSLKGLPIPPTSRVNALDQAGSVIYKNRAGEENGGVTSVIDAYLTSTKPTAAEHKP